MIEYYLSSNNEMCYSAVGRVYVFVFEKKFGDHRKRYTGRNFAVFR